MSSVRQSFSFNSSTVSSQISSYDDVEITKIKHYVKDLLKSRIFLGRYIERRLIDSQIGYRDIVLLSAAEVELKKDLLETHCKLKLAYPNLNWICIADAEVFGISTSGLCVWTEIENQPFGPFWFQIKTIKFREDEIVLAVKCVRHISEAYLEIEPILTGSAKKTREVNQKVDESSSHTLNEAYIDIVETLKSGLSISNVKEFVTFIFAFVIAIFTGSTSFINFLGNFVLALLRELSILIKNSTPMFLGVLDFFSKIIGGFYILLAMFFKPNPVSPNKRSVSYYNQYPQRSQNYDDRQFD